MWSCVDVKRLGFGGFRGADGCCNQQTASQCNGLREGTVSTPKGYSCHYSQGATGVSTPKGLQLSIHQEVTAVSAPKGQQLHMPKITSCTRHNTRNQGSWGTCARKPPRWLGHARLVVLQQPKKYTDRVLLGYIPAQHVDINSSAL